VTAVQAPENFFRFAESGTTHSLGDLPWWQGLKNPVLQNLIGPAIMNNYDLIAGRGTGLAGAQPGGHGQLRFLPTDRLWWRHRSRT